jgi:hypothetical protein
MKKLGHVFLMLFITCQSGLIAQEAVDTISEKKRFAIKDVREKDMSDLFRKKTKHSSVDNSFEKQKKQFSFIPAAGYSLQTGFAGILSANLAYYNDTAADAKMSSIATSITYSQYNQILLPLTANIWTKNNKYNFISDNRIIDYPSNIYGVGGRTDPNKGHQIAFKGLKLHETVMKSISKNWYVGLGIYYDQMWDIKVLDSVTRRLNNTINRQLGTSEIAIGLAARISYDSRLNQINAKNGWFVNAVLRDSRKFLGSDNDWQSLIIDIRKYIPFPKHSKNTLALWSYNWMILNGKAPYLLLPSTGWDDQYNTGRGYIQGRFRGSQMYYGEAEYRFNLTRNGILGAVVFGNLQYFSPDISPQFQVLTPGYGGGLRIKLNKHSGTNLCIDYGFGKDGSKGFFVNLGEVF